MNRRKFLKSLAAAGAAAYGLGSAAGFSAFARPADASGFSFAHITDLHLDLKGSGSGWQYREKSGSLFTEALAQARKLPKLDFVVFGGDQIHYGPNDRDSLDFFQKNVSDLGIPHYVLLGNTEVSPVKGVSNLTKDDYANAWSNAGLKPDQTSWSFAPVPWAQAIGLDVTVEGKPFGEVKPKELLWLEDELKKNAHKKVIILFTHQLLMPTCERDKTPQWSFWMVKNHARVNELLKLYPNVRMVVSGHHHAAKVETVGRITYVSDPGTVTYPCAFRAFTVTKEGIALKIVPVGDAAVTGRAKDLLVSDPFAKIYDPAAPGNAAAYTAGLNPDDRETFVKL